MNAVYKKIEQDNVKLRNEYLSEFQCYSSEDIRAFASKNEHDCALTWEKQGRIFSVKNNGVDVFPSFQFQDGKPLEIIERLLSQIPNDMSNWQTAFWFVSGNGYIENQQAPKDSFELKDDLAAAVKALSEEIYW